MRTKSAPLRILVVDDDALIRWSLVEMLPDSGCEAIAVTDAKSAVQSSPTSRRAYTHGFADDLLAP